MKSEDTGNTNSKRLFAWKMTLVLLSLDRVTPFWDELGLGLRNVESTKAAARSWLLKVQAYDDQDEDDLDYADKVGILVTGFLGEIQVIEGVAAPVEIQVLVEKFMLFFSESWRGAWQTLIGRLTRSGAPLLRHRGLSQEKVQKVIELSEMWTQTEASVSRRVEQADAEPLNGWDQSEYRRYRRESADDLSPLDYLSLLMRNLTFERIWGQLVEMLGPGDMDILNACGQVESVVNTSIPASMAEIPPKYRIV